MFSKRMILVALVIVLVAVNIVLLTITGKHTQAPSGLGRGALVIVSPFQKQFTAFFDSVKDTWNQYFFLVSKAKENQRLKKALGQSLEQLNRYSETEIANDRLRHLIGFEKEIPRPMIAAQVVGKDPSAWSKTIIVDKGTRDSVRQGAPVVIPEGIVGVVVEASARYAKVLLLTDPNSAVDALVQQTRARGIVKGGGADYCVFDYVLRKHEISVGDMVVSSGLDGVFPKGFRVGRISEIVRQNAGIFQKVSVTPYVDFEILEEVFIISEPAYEDNPRER
ncbi:rod shape-determining protein MreC [Desulfosarcina sp.]|uniref:rod shape-determining protein MreC n=1 Tax=Desulfosarcina sp. TaxID=2027861 RepID=UPI0029A9B29A|nr:rod shape-determining protein MreC [Desulfosarcina sp.]MDX2452487.1 rod shape-determining protein MreC [Desulfosarcina sp.]MDX2490261.1 rod shape-determining protein MreC [Desulfosarcina sp.]